MATTAAVYDFNSGKTKREAFSAAVVALIDDANVTFEKSRGYLGASQIGDECQRRIQYTLRNAPSEPLHFKSKRIFDRGHTYEAKAADWLRSAGFELRTESIVPKRAFGFSVANARFRGHIDGILFSGPQIEGLVYPAIWENKALSAKNYTALVKNGVAKAHPKYADQIALYQIYMDNLNPALLTAENADTMEIHAELVAFDPARAQEASDRAVKILKAEEVGELLPRVASDQTQFPCPWCRFKDTCWGG